MTVVTKDIKWKEGNARHKKAKKKKEINVIIVEKKRRRVDLSSSSSSDHFKYVDLIREKRERKVEPKYEPPKRGCKHH